jgi:hypothetical protein
MGHDDFDDAPPPDEEAEDFTNFDPETYLRRRNAGQPDEPLETEEDSQPSGSDAFSTFNAGDYLKKRYSGRSYLSQSPREQAAYTGQGRRGRRNDPASARIREIDKEVAGGERRGCFSRLFDVSERFGLVREILTEGGPVVRIVGCVLVLALGAICVAGYLILSAVTQHP